MTQSSGRVWQELEFSHLPERQRFDAFQASYKGPFEFSNFGIPTCNIQYKVKQIGPITITNVRFPQLQAKLKPHARHSGDPDVLYLAMFRRGTINGIAGDTGISGTVGEIHMADLSRGLTVLLNDVHHLSAYIPHKLLGYDPTRHSSHGSVARLSGGGRILAAGLMALHRLPAQEPLDNDAADAFLAVARQVLIGRVLDERACRLIDRARRAELRRYIEDRLTDPNLNVEAVCQAFGASRATIYRDFAEWGGIRNYIQSRRLEHARIALVSSRPDRGAVSRIAERYGFVCQAHFNRAFRATFGTTPGSVLGSEVASLQN